MGVVIWHFDLELMKKDLDWAKESQLAIVWRKPELMVKVTAVDGGF